MNLLSDKQQRVSKLQKLLLRTVNLLLKWVKSILDQQLFLLIVVSNFPSWKPWNWRMGKRGKREVVCSPKRMRMVKPKQTQNWYACLFRLPCFVWPMTGSPCLIRELERVVIITPISPICVCEVGTKRNQAIDSAPFSHHKTDQIRFKFKYPLPKKCPPLPYPSFQPLLKVFKPTINWK